MIYAEKRKTAPSVAEARAVNINNIIADDAYRVHEQIHCSTHKPAKPKHRKTGELREVPLPRSVRKQWAARGEARHHAGGPSCAAR
ncbi:hypothetical protein ABZ923_40060 [Streptomyces sp. NPDC046881]|uniref:hypothetical protein n=1 Tax=Streptomyces sp. NPDC046881 TaxID=3155374 RepID=UPI0033CABF7B